LERTLVLIKPDACARHLIGAILAIYEQSGLTIEQLRLLKPGRELVAAHYAEHRGQPYYPGLIENLTGVPVVAAVIEGDQAIARVRELNGATDPAAAAPGTIRARYGLDKRRNSVHASDSPVSAAREIALWFGEV
jgi:nucleoside-diphosphate kinase